MARRSLAVSAPGKVLFTGGFLVLDRRHTGLVFGLDARIHVHIDEWKPKDTSVGEKSSALILVQSPQFQDASWLYEVVHAQIDAAILVRQITE